VTVKKRGSPLEPEILIHDLHLKGEQERVVFLTQLRDKPIVIVAYPEEVSQN
jgi:peroxiredoxin